MTTRTTRRRKTAAPRPIVGDPDQIEKNQAAIMLLQSWLDVSEEEAQEQRETFEFLKQALDERRPAGYKLFE